MTDRPIAPPLWRNTSFTLMWTSTAASGFGDRMVLLAALALLGGLATGADSVSVSAAVNFWFFLPYLMFGVLGGYLADRLPRKWLMMGCDEGRALCLLLGVLLVGQAAGVTTVPEGYRWQIMAVVFLIGTGAAIFNPTRNAIIPQLVPTTQIQPANAILIGIGVVASMIGVLAGGFIIDPGQPTSVRTGLLVGMGFYLVSGVFFAFLRPTPARSTPRAMAGSAASARRSPGEAVAYLSSHRRIIILIALNVMIWAAAMVVLNGVLALADQNYGFTDQKVIWSRYTWLLAATGLGMLGGAGAVGVIASRRESATILMSGLVLAGACTLALPLTGVFWLGMALAFGVGVFGNGAIITIATLLQSMAPNFIRGRVMGISALASNVGTVLVNLAIWQIPHADRQIVWAMYLIGAGLMIVGLVGVGRHLMRGPLNGRGLNLMWHITRLGCFSWHNLRLEGRDNVPATGPVILASNHTTALDPFLIQSGCHRLVRWVMLRAFRFKLIEPIWRQLDPICLDLDQGDLGAIREIVRALKQGKVVGLFPEGGLQREHRDFQPLKPGIGVIARRSGAPIVPVWVQGTPQSKSMLVHLLCPSRSRVTFGEPFIPDPTMKPDAIVKELRRRMLALGEGA